ncbi:MAG: ABC transporter ATP-binding protein [Eubacteriales bacterium]
MNLKCEKLDKYYGNTQVLKNVTFECKSGEITGIIGRNGAGKTVLFKALCGLVSIDDGKIYIDESEKKNGQMMKSAGIIIEEPAFLGSVSGIQNLKYLYMINYKYDRKYISSIMQKVGLDPNSRKHVSKYSMGMRQRLAIAQAIMENPEVLILDEPFNGLDNHGVEEMRLLLQEMKKEGKTILVASHNAEDIRILCDNVFQMDGGILTKIR